MITAIRCAQRLDWGGWVRGAVGALVSGGAGAVGGGFGAMFADPSHDFSIGVPGGSKHLLMLMVVAFLFSGGISLAKFLQIHPVPGDNLLENGETRQSP